MFKIKSIFFVLSRDPLPGLERMQNRNTCGQTAGAWRKSISTDEPPLSSLSSCVKSLRSATWSNERKTEFQWKAFSIQYTTRAMRFPYIEYHHTVTHHPVSRPLFCKTDTVSLHSQKYTLFPHCYEFSPKDCCCVMYANG